jgi:uncharacterized caspase-like protein/Tfp pilus assembly protein PilF
MRVLKRFALALVAAWLALAMGAPAWADGRVALVIANSAYVHAPKLPNPPNDARSMAAALRKVGFATTEKADLNKRDLEAALKAFAQAARGADVAVIYYAGHGMEQGGLNYLVPVDATLASDQDVEFDTVPLDLLLRSVEGASRLKLVVLDACRNNPFLTTMQRASGTRAIGRGLSRVEPEGDTLVAYAAREGSTADDGDGGDSPFTKALTTRMLTPGLEIRLLFGQVRDDVLASTARRQEPAIYGSLGGQPFYFVAPSTAVATAAPTPPVAPALTTIPGGLGSAERPNNPAANALAIARFDDALRTNPRDPQALLGRALVHMQGSEWDPAIADLTALIAIRPGNASAFHNRGRARFAKGDVEGAVADMTEAIRLMPGNEDSYTARARFYRQKGQMDLAMADNQKAISLKGDAETYYQRGLTYVAKGDTTAAVADFDKSLALDPDNTRASDAKARLAKK